MGIFDEMEAREGIVIVKSLAQKLYEKQLKDIINICHTDGYNQIKDYWIRVKEGAEQQLNNVEEKDLKITQLKRNIANDYLTFLSNLETTKEVKEKVKKK